MAKFCDLCKRWDPCSKDGCRIAVNSPVVNAPTVNTVVHAAVNRRGSYPNTEARRAYMKTYMAKRRKGAQAGPMA